MQPHESTIEARVHDRPGVLARVASMFHRRGLNLTALSVRPITGVDHAWMRIETFAPPDELERMRRAMANLVDVIDVEVRPSGN